jgi:hypothetical protein
MHSEGCYGLAAKPDTPAIAGLGSFEDAPGAGFGECPPDLERAGVKVHVFPAECQ